MRWLAAMICCGTTPVAAQLGPDPADLMPAELPACTPPLDGVCFEFTTSAEGWHVPEWSFTAADHARAARPRIHAADGEVRALRIEAELPPTGWGAVVLELREAGPLSDYETLVARLRVRGRDEVAMRWVAVVGSLWTWLEAADAVPLEDGEWTEVSIPIRSLGVDGRATRRLIVRLESAGTGTSTDRITVDLDFVRLIARDPEPSGA